VTSHAVAEPRYTLNCIGDRNITIRRKKRAVTGVIYNVLCPSYLLQANALVREKETNEEGKSDRQE
jgi:hypothetical protein